MRIEVLPRLRCLIHHLVLACDSRLLHGLGKSLLENARCEMIGAFESRTRGNVHPGQTGTMGARDLDCELDARIRVQEWVEKNEDVFVAHRTLQKRLASASTSFSCPRARGQESSAPRRGSFGGLHPRSLVVVPNPRGFKSPSSKSRALTCGRWSLG